MNRKRDEKPNIRPIMNEAGTTKPSLPTAGPADLALTFISPVDGSPQPYRLYLPSAHDGTRAVPLLVALHGTGGDQNKYFDHRDYGDGLYKREAEKHGMAVLCPLGNDALGRPTEWRGTGELHVLAALEEVCRRFCIDRERIVCTGQSMGGTGTTYLCCRYPDRFAAGIPLASNYGHVALVANLRHVPMFFVQGEKDWPYYAKNGPIPLSQEMHRLGYDGTLWMVPDAAHNTMSVSTGRVFEWATRQRHTAHPRHITHRAFFPAHGRAWWVEITAIASIGGFAEVDARIVDGNRIEVATRNAAGIILRPDPASLNLDTPLQVAVDGCSAFAGLCPADRQVRLTCQDDGWHGRLEPRHEPSRLDWRAHAIGEVDEAPDWSGDPESTLGNWLTDVIRTISGADIAITPKGHFRYRDHNRGVPVQPGQTVYLANLIDWLRPGDSALVAFPLVGRDLLRIIEGNLLDGPEERRFLVQVSGCRYAFDRRRPIGQRVVSSDIEPERIYTVAAKGFDVSRDDTLHLGDLQDRLGYRTLDTNLLSAIWRYTVDHDGRIAARLEGRIKDTP
jgi:poly(3-hydroxybutyrate) depolymerase